MGMTMTQKILAAHAGLPEVKAGQLIEADLDLVLGNDVTAPVAIHEMEKFEKKQVFDKDKIALVPDHFTPNKDIKSAEHCKCVRNFAKENEITNYFEIGEMGIEHALLPEKGLVVAGDVVIGADSHTCTYGALGAFSTGVGSTDMAAGMVTGKAWFKVPDAIKFVLKNQPAKWVSGKDIILHIIGLIGVDGALYKSMEFVGDGIAIFLWMTALVLQIWQLKLEQRMEFSLLMSVPSNICKNIPSRNIRAMKLIWMQNMMKPTLSI